MLSSSLRLLHTGVIFPALLCFQAWLCSLLDSDDCPFLVNAMVVMVMVCVIAAAFLLPLVCTVPHK